MRHFRLLRTGVVAVLAATTLAAGSLAAGAAEGAAADEPYQGTYSASASADGLRVTMTLPAAPLSNTVADVGGPTAQAVLDSNGTSQAFASFPYPGANLAVAGGLIKGASNGQVPAPDYPFYVVAYNPAVPEQSVGSGPYAIKAQSTGNTSQGTASAGVNTPGVGTLGFAEATAATQSSKTAVAGSSSSRITGLAIGPLEIGELMSSAATSLGSDGVVNKKAETRLVAAKVGLTPVVLDANGLSAGGTAGPAPDTKGVQDALAGAGISVQLFPKEETDTGVVAPVLRITQKQAQTGAVLTYTLGGTSAFVQGSPSSDASSTLDEAVGGDTPAQAPDSGATASGTGGDNGALPNAEAASAAPDLAAGSSDGSTSIPVDAATLSIPDAASAGSSSLGGGGSEAALGGGALGGSGSGGGAASLSSPDSSTPSSSNSIALASGFLVTRSHAAPTLIALTALIALALVAALAVHLLGKEARS